MTDSTLYIKGIIARARKAQEAIEYLDQNKIDDLCERIAWATVQDDFVKTLAELAVSESAMGDVPSKIAKMMNKVRGGWADMKNQKSVGIIEENPELGLIKIAKPVGVIGAMIPCTNCEATPVLKSMSAIKTRNAIVLAPHPRTRKTNENVVNKMRQVLKDNGYPEDLIIHMDVVSMDNSRELMNQCDLILATGGGGLVNTAYSSGTPAYGVGAGNAVTVIDETRDLMSVADKIKRSKTFDQATSCSAENACLVKNDIYDEFITAMENEGGYLLSGAEKERLQNLMWVDGHLNKDIVAQPAESIAKMAGISLPESKCFLMVGESGIGEGFPFSGEKLSVVVAIYRWDNFEEAIEMVNSISSFSGAGHSCGIHTDSRERILALAEKVKVSRVMVNQPQSLGNSGGWTNGMPMTLTLGCGTWGGNISSENITWRHLMNTTWVSSPIADRRPSDESLFRKEVRAVSVL